MTKTRKSPVRGRSVALLLCGQACDNVIIRLDNPILFAQACFLNKWLKHFVLSLHGSQRACLFFSTCFFFDKIHYERQPLGLKLIWNSPSRQL